MKYLKLFESNSLEEIKNLEYILKDEGLVVKYTFSNEGPDNRYYDSDEPLMLKIKSRTSNNIKVHVGYADRMWPNKGYEKFRTNKDIMDFLKVNVYEKEYFEEYVDRISVAFKSSNYGSISIFINGYIFLVINRHGSFPSAFL